MSADSVPVDAKKGYFRVTAMDEWELREKAMHYRRMATLVSDHAVTKELLELADQYEALAEALTIENSTQREGDSGAA